MLVNRRELLSFFDEDDRAHTHANAIKAVAGEELGLALLLRYFKESGRQATRLTVPCTTGSRKGHRLDAWVRTIDDTGPLLYQVEVKTWSLHSFGGAPLAVDCSSDIIREYKLSQWKVYFHPDRGFVDKELQKVFEPMRSPEPDTRVEPLACLWVAVHDQGSDEPFFRLPAPFSPFGAINVFSMSAYLHNLSDTHIDLDLPDTQTRLDYLSRLFASGA